MKTTTLPETANCDHDNLTTAFCPHCGLKPVKEDPGPALLAWIDTVILKLKASFRARNNKTPTAKQTNTLKLYLARREWVARKLADEAAAETPLS